MGLRSRLEAWVGRVRLGLLVEEVEAGRGVVQVDSLVGSPSEERDLRLNEMSLRNKSLSRAGGFSFKKGAFSIDG